MPTLCHTSPPSGSRGHGVEDFCFAFCFLFFVKRPESVHNHDFQNQLLSKSECQDSCRSQWGHLTPFTFKRKSILKLHYLIVLQRRGKYSYVVYFCVCRPFSCGFVNCSRSDPFRVEKQEKCRSSLNPWFRLPQPGHRIHLVHLFYRFIIKFCPRRPTWFIYNSHVHNPWIFVRVCQGGRGTVQADIYSCHGDSLRFLQFCLPII